MASVAKSKVAKRKKKQYKIYDLSNKEDRKEFSDSLVQDTFALIKIPEQYKSSLCDLFNIFEGLFASRVPLQCDHNQQYVGYTSTVHLKQSLWFYQNYENKTLFPKIKNNKSILYKNDNDKKVYQGFSDYNGIANDAMHAILKYQCKDNESYIKCWNNLFPKNKIKGNDDNEDVDEKKNDVDDNKKYPESAVYNAYRKIHDLSLNNLAVINYYGEKNKKTKKGLFEKFKTKNNDNNNDNKIKKDIFSCEEHIDYPLITLIMANEPGLQVRDIMYFEWIDIEDIIKSNNMNRKDVIIVITGLTLGTLMHDRVPCYHSVKKLYTTNDRISFPLFVYSDPNGIIDTKLIKQNLDFRITLKDDNQIISSHYLAKNMHPSVNF